ncbi:MAG TPA: hypothetical protein VGR18_12860 [Rubrobacter sp.]|nr:hypothetical protein [Rubrobacter sp.]
MRTAEYERVVLGELRRILIEPGGQAANLRPRGATHGGVRVDRVYLDRPGCPFGYRIEAVGTPDVLHDSTDPYSDPVSAATAWGEIVWVLFEEQVFASGYGLPRDCSPGVVTWI